MNKPRTKLLAGSSLCESPDEDLGKWESQKTYVHVKSWELLDVKNREDLLKKKKKPSEGGIGQLH